MKIGVIAKKQVSTWNRANVKFKDFFKALGKGGIDVATGQWISAGKDGMDALSAIGIAEQTPENLAWALIYNSMLLAIENLVTDCSPLLCEKAKSFDFLIDDLDLSFENKELEITTNFFYFPKQLSILQNIQVPLKQWLEIFGLESYKALSLSKRLPTYFVFALHEEWRNHREYSQLTQQIQTPFTTASQREHDWLLYRSWLNKQIEEPMMPEAFGLKDIYIPLRGFYRQKSHIESDFHDFRKRNFQEKDKLERVVVDLESGLQKWLIRADKNDAIRVISGGPGSGKSSFVKVFAANHCQNFDLSILFIPLHYFDFSGDLIDSVNGFIKFDQFLRENPLNPDNEKLRLLIIFDGLDELAIQSRLSKEATQLFVRELQNKVNKFNKIKLRLQVIITGRDVVVQESFHELQQIFHVLPYFVDKNSVEKSNEAYIDPENYLDNDQRIDWWKKYATAIEILYENLPRDLHRGDLAEITSQPLLNYLVALSYSQGKLVISEQMNLNRIYEDLLNAVYERGYEQRGKESRHSSLRDLTKEQFILILEEVALAIWHGNGRNRKASEIEHSCKLNGLDQLLTTFEDGADSGLIRLLATFYFRQCNDQNNERTFEFTHKSFGEYLTSRRIVRAMDQIQEQMNLRGKDKVSGWDERDALFHWVEICGPFSMDNYLIDFLKREVSLKDYSKVFELQQLIIKLIEFMLFSGMPMEMLIPPLNYFSANSWAINAEESLLAMLSVCSNTTQETSMITWPNMRSSGTWMKRFQWQRSNQKAAIFTSCLNDFNLANSNLFWMDLHGANLERANLMEANLEGANLEAANLMGANLEGANLEGANLEGANLEGANLERANLMGANLLGAFLVRGNLENSNLTGANCVEASLVEANLDGANLEGVLLGGANLDGVNLEKTNLENASLSSRSKGDISSKYSESISTENNEHTNKTQIISKEDLREQLGREDLKRKHQGGRIQKDSKKTIPEQRTDINWEL